MTEEEAKKRWCPMVRTVDNNGAVTNKTASGNIYKIDQCIASECMMWRWEHVQKKKACAHIKMYDSGPNHKHVIYDVGECPDCHAPSIGYCGLGGRPQEE